MEEFGKQHSSHKVRYDCPCYHASTLHNDMDKFLENGNAIRPGGADTIRFIGRY